MSGLCPTCGCSLVRLGIARHESAQRRHNGEELLFCCERCAGLLEEQPDRYLEEIRDWIVCPSCLAEKPRRLTVSLLHEGREIRFCRCPGCVEEVRKRPNELLARLEI